MVVRITAKEAKSRSEKNSPVAERLDLVDEMIDEATKRGETFIFLKFTYKDPEDLQKEVVGNLKGRGFQSELWNELTWRIAW